MFPPLFCKDWYETGRRIQEAKIDCSSEMVALHPHLPSSWASNLRNKEPIYWRWLNEISKPILKVNNDLIVWLFLKIHVLISHMRSFPLFISHVLNLHVIQIKIISFNSSVDLRRDHWPSLDLMHSSPFPIGLWDTLSFKDLVEHLLDLFFWDFWIF